MIPTSFLLLTSSLLPAIPQVPSGDCASTPNAAEAAALLAQQAAGLYDLAVPAASAMASQSNHVVPIAAHIVRQSNGVGGLPQSRLDTAIVDANTDFAPAHIEFCLAAPVDIILSDAFYFDIDTMAEIDALRTTNVVPGMLNIYFTENLAYEFGGLCGISSFTTSSVQGIAMNNSCTATFDNHSTFSHEIGHYFDLYHTHETAFGEECVNASNCLFAGDLVCDTPADPNVNGLVDQNCFYTGGAVDSCNGQSYNPSTSNLMSYSRKECRTHFSPMQIFRAEATLVNLRPNLAFPICAAGYALYCSPAMPNSSGLSASIGVMGSGRATDNNLVLTCNHLPTGQFAYFLVGTAQGTPIQVPGSQGNLCLGGSIGRYNHFGQVMSTGTSGEVSFQPDLTQTPQGSLLVAIQAGQTRYFQLWYRDWVGVSTSNFSDTVALTFN
ncbi:MAG: M43 family zinc metalloprotease [Planctomycetota bacterium]